VGLEYGCESKELDMNYFNGTIGQFNFYFGLNSQPPTNGGTMQIIKGDVLGSVFIRVGAGATYPDVGHLSVGDKIEARGNMYQWLNLSKINDMPCPSNWWASAGSSQQYIKWAWVTVTDPVVDPPPPPAEITPPDYILAYWMATNQTRKYLPE